MNCQYINTNDLHEKYLLDQINESLKVEYLSHIRECDDCRTELERHRILIYSVRQAGKNEMKSEIARQVKELKAKNKIVDWGLIYKIAAIFLILVITPGLVYYYQNVEQPKQSEEFDAESLFMEKNNINTPESTDKTDQIKTVSTKHTREKRAEAAKSYSQKGEKKSGTQFVSDDGMNEIELLAGGGVSSDKLSLENESKEPVVVISPAAPLYSKKELLPSKKFIKPIAVTYAINSKSSDAVSKLSKKKNEIITSNSINPLENSRTIDSDKNNSMAGGRVRKSNSILMQQESPKGIYNLEYLNDNMTIIVNVELLKESSFWATSEMIPEKFAVIISEKDSSQLKMNWLINDAFLKVEPNDIRLILQQDTVFINVPGNIYYQIPLQTDSTYAILKE